MFTFFAENQLAALITRELPQVVNSYEDIGLVVECQQFNFSQLLTVKTKKLPLYPLPVELVKFHKYGMGFNLYLTPLCLAT